MGLHELAEHFLFALLISSGEAGLFLPLIVHHFLDYATGFAIQVTELGVFRLDLLCVDLDVALNYAVPPALLVLLRQ